MPTDIQLETAIDTANSAKSLRELSKSLRDLISLQGDIGAGTADFKKLQEAITKTEGRVGDLNDSFGTLRGSGIERVNASLGLFRDGLSNADPDKLSIAMEGLGSAMKAIPIFLLIEGAKLLYENWDKLTSIFSESAQQVKANEIALRKLTIQVDLQNASVDRNIIIQENQLSILKQQSAPLQNIIDKLKEIDTLKQSKIQGELQKTDKEILNLAAKIKKAREDFNTKTNVEDLLGVGTTQDDINKLEDELVKLQLKRSDLNNQSLANEFKTESDIFDVKKQAADKANALLDKNAQDAYDKLIKDYNRKQELNKRQIDEDKSTYEELDAMRKKDAEQQSETEDTLFLTSLSKGNKEFEIEQVEREKHLQGKLDALATARDKELSQVNENSEASYLIEKKYSDLAFQAKVKNISQYANEAKSAIDILNGINTIIAQNENYSINQIKYQKDAELENNKNRTQEQINIETKKTNDLLANESLSAQEIEKIKYNSETNINQIQANSANAELQIKNDLDKQSLEIRRKQFEREKKIQLVTAAINTASAVLNALGTVQPFPAALFAAGLAATSGAVQIGVIANTKFDDGGASANSSIKPITPIDTRAAPTSGNPSTQAVNSQQTGQLLGSGLTTNSNGINRVYVLENDIRNASNKVDVLESRSTFGI